MLYRLLVASGFYFNILVLQLFLVQVGFSGLGVFPSCGVHVVGIVTLGFAFGCLVLLAEVTASGLFTVQCIATHQLAKLKEKLEAAGLPEEVQETVDRELRKLEGSGYFRLAVWCRSFCHWPELDRQGVYLSGSDARMAGLYRRSFIIALSGGLPRIGCMGSVVDR